MLTTIFWCAVIFFFVISITVGIADKLEADFDIDPLLVFLCLALLDIVVVLIVVIHTIFIQV